MKVILVAYPSSLEKSFVQLKNRECAYFSFSLGPDSEFLLKVILNIQREELKQNWPRVNLDLRGSIVEIL